MSAVRFLADTSAVIRLLRDSAVLAQWHDTVTAGLVATCPITELEAPLTAFVPRHTGDTRRWPLR